MSRYTDVDLQNKRLPPVGEYWNEDVVPLEVALKPVEQLFNDLSRSIKVAKKYCTFPSEHGLTRDESAAVYLYTMEGSQNSFYRVLNEALRSENRLALKLWFLFLKLFDVALNKLPIVKSSVWRGVPSDVSGQFMKNQVLTWWSISSCSKSMSIIQDFLSSSNSSTLFMIEAVSARDVSNYSYYPNENEVLLGLGTELRVKVDMLQQPDGLNVVHLVQLSEEDDDDDEELPKAIDKMDFKLEVSVAGAIGIQQPSSKITSNPVVTIENWTDLLVMTANSWDQSQSSKSSKQQTTTTTEIPRLAIGRGKPRPETNNDESPPPVASWNSGGSSGTSNGYKGFGSNNNDENNNPNNNSGGFGSRNGSSFGGRSERGGFGGGGGRGGYGPRNDGNSRDCFNCGQTGHMSRECPEPRNSNRGRGGFGAGGNRGGFGAGGNRGGFGENRGGFGENRGGFNSGGGDRNVSYNSQANGGNPSMSVTVPNSRNQNDYNQDGDRERKPDSSSWGNGGSNDNDGRNYNGRSTSRGGGGGGFGDRRGGFNSGDRDNRNAGGDSNNWQNNNRSGNQSRDYHGDRRPGGDGNDFSSGGGRRNDQTSDGDPNQSGGRSAGQPVERYIPPPAPTSEDDIFGEAASKGENFDKYQRTHVQCTPPGKFKPIELYEEANLGTQVLSNIRRAHFEEPTPIQRYTIPCIREQHDIMACAQTGSGKTAAFLLPIISNLLEFHAEELSERPNVPSPLCLILSPTRELALQTEREARKFAYQTPVLPCSVVSGYDTFSVTDRLREGCHILSATIGRLKGMVEKGRISLKQVKYFVLDEADRMLDIGFEPDIRKLEVLGIPPKEKRLTSMFSAILPEEVQNLARHFLRDDYVFLAVGTPGGANEDIAQTIEEVPQANKKERLLELLEQNLKTERCLIFVETKRSADYLGTILTQKNLMSTTIHGDRNQRQRNEAVEQFTHGKCPILVATSDAARGLDFPLTSYVVNYDLPDTIDYYIYRIGRTGRAGHFGKSISFFDPSRESDRNIAPELIAKLEEVGQDVPEFLLQYKDGANAESAHGSTGFGSRTADMRSGGNQFKNRHHQRAGWSGGSAFVTGALASDEWNQ